MPETSASNPEVEPKILAQLLECVPWRTWLHYPCFSCVIVQADESRTLPDLQEGAAQRTKNFPFCSARCKLVDAGNWFEGTYRIEADLAGSIWGEN